MDRRVFIGTLAGDLLAAPLGAEAQQAGQRVPHIGILTPQKLSDSNLPDFWGSVSTRVSSSVASAAGGSSNRMT
jgi:hypothetical protein